MSYEQSINNYVEGDRSEIVKTLQDLVKIPSLTGEEKEIGAYIANFCESIGLDVEVIEAEPGRPNVVARWDTGLPGPTLLLQDHLDTFPPGDIDRWKYHPYAATVEGEHMYGRGTVDTKSGVTTILRSVKAIKDLGLPLCGKLLVVFSCDEETGGSELGLKHLIDQDVIQADLALVAEPTTMKIEVGTKSRLLVHITTRGIATHGARPWLGRNAILDMVKVIQQLEKLDQDIQARTHPDFGPSSMNIGRIEGGTIPNIIPDVCTIQVDRRLLPSETRESACQEIQDILDRLSDNGDILEPEFEVKQWWPGYHLDAEEPVIALLSNAYRSALGDEPVLDVKDAATEASWINLLAGVPVAMFSPGDGERAGNIDESVRIDDLVNATKVVSQFIRLTLEP